MARRSSLTRRILVGVLFGVVVYLGISIWVGIDEFQEALADFNWWLVLAAMGLSLANYLIRFAKWERYRTLLGIELDRATSFNIYMAGFSMGITPGKMGEVLKSWLIKKVTGTRIHHSAPIVVAERITDLLGFLILLAIGGIASQPDYAWIFWSVLALCAVVLSLAGSEGFSVLVYRVVKNTPYFWRLAPKVEGSFASTRVLLRPREILLPTIISVFSWGCECVGFWLIAGGFVEGGVDFLFAVFVYAFSAVAGAVLILFPGGIGPTDFSMGTFLRREYSSALDPTAFGAGELAGEALNDALVTAARPLAGAAVLLTRICTLWFGVGIGLIALGIFRRRHGSIEDLADESLDEDG